MRFKVDRAHLFGVVQLELADVVLVGGLLK